VARKLPGKSGESSESDQKMMGDGSSPGARKVGKDRGGLVGKFGEERARRWRGEAEGKKLPRREYFRLLSYVEARAKIALPSPSLAFLRFPIRTRSRVSLDPPHRQTNSTCKIVGARPLKIVYFDNVFLNLNKFILSSLLRLLSSYTLLPGIITIAGQWSSSSSRRPEINRHACKCHAASHRLVATVTHSIFPLSFQRLSAASICELHPTLLNTYHTHSLLYE
jgi:hypothetical protein